MGKPIYGAWRRICPVCGNYFYATTEWAYKYYDKKSCRKKYCCTYHCLMDYYKKQEKEDTSKPKRGGKVLKSRITGEVISATALINRGDVMKNCLYGALKERGHYGEWYLYDPEKDL